MRWRIVAVVAIVITSHLTSDSKHHSHASIHHNHLPGKLDCVVMVAMSYAYCLTSACRPGDSGQGESDSENDTSSDNEDELVSSSHELIKWKKGRLIDKGAFSKVSY